MATTDTIDGRPCAELRNFMTVDVEDYFSAEALARAAPREDWASLPSRVERNTDRLLERFERHGVRATFFVLGWVAERFPDLVRRIAAQGHEIGSHGYSHRRIFTQTREDFREETLRSRHLLQDLSGQAVRGYRAASFSITKRSLWALDELASAGFSYDSSIFPIRHDLYGIPGSPPDPYWLQTAAGPLFEIPLTTLRIGPFRLPASGGGYFRLLPERIGTGLLRGVNGEGRSFVFYMHPWEIDPGQPRFDVGLRSRLRHYTNLGAFEQRLERLLSRFALTALEDCLTRARTRSDLPRLEPMALAT